MALAWDTRRMVLRVVVFALSCSVCACAASSGPSRGVPAADARALACDSPSNSPLPPPTIAESDAVGPLLWGAPIRKLILDAPPEIPSELIREVLLSREGGPLEQKTVQGDVRRLHALSVFQDIDVGATLELDGLTLTYRLVPHPRIARGFVAGDAESALLARHRPRAGEIYDPRELATRRTLLSAELQADGYRRAEVQHRVHTSTDGRVTVCLKVDRGRRFAISKIAFDGIRSVTRQELLALMDTREDHVNTVGRPVYPKLFDLDRLRMLALLYDRGFVTAEIDEPTIEQDDRTGEVRVAFSVREGDLFEVGELHFTGGLIAPAEVYAELVGLAPGDRFSRKRVLDGIEKIRALHTSMGRPSPDVRPETALHASSKTIDLEIRVGGN